MLDSGANTRLKNRSISVQSAVYGVALMHSMFLASSIRVGLLNIGEEGDERERAGEGDSILCSRQSPTSYFCGNAEGRDVPKGNFDVVICDGFVGNVVLKFIEAAGKRFWAHPVRRFAVQD